MILILIKLEQGMVQVIHGVNNKKKLALYNLPLSIQTLSINLFISIVGFVFLILYNYFLINSDSSIENNKVNAVKNLNNIQLFLKKNSIIRVPVFNESCIAENNIICKNEDNFELSDPILEPKITQEYILNNYSNSRYNIKIYNDDWIRLVDTMDLYELSIVKEIDLEDFDEIENKRSISKFFSNKYLSLFSMYYDYFVKTKFLKFATNKKAEIFYVAESIKNKTIKEYIIRDEEDNFYQYHTAPIVNNNKVYGVIILSYEITNQFTDLSLTSLNIFIFFISFIFIMILMSLIFSQSLVRPIKKLSKLTILERERVGDNKIKYPIRNDEIGALSREIQNMSRGLNYQIKQIEKFSADVSHELKNPLTSLQTAVELISKDKIDKYKKNLLLQNVHKDLKRMNQLITDISNFTRLKAEIELEKNQYLELNDFLDELPQIFMNNTKKINLILQKLNQNIIILANKNKLIQVFVNLIENSISLSPNESKILIEVNKVDSKEVSIKLYDQGKGINLKDSKKIFDRFYSDREENEKNHTGLGLSIAKEIITHMQGKIYLDKSEKIEYSGACFLITLPVRQLPKLN